MDKLEVLSREISKSEEKMKRLAFDFAVANEKAQELRAQFRRTRVEWKNAQRNYKKAKEKS